MTLRPTPLIRRTPLAAVLAALTLLAAPAGAQPAIAYANLSPISGDNVGPPRVTRDAAGNTYVAGDFQGTLDLDPTDPPDASDTVASGGTNNGAYLASYDPAGALRWALSVPAPGPTALLSRAVAVDGTQVYVAGTFDGTPDFDPGPGLAMLAGPSGHYIAAYDLATGAFRWANARPRIFATALVANGGRVTAAGTFTGTVDFDPGPGTAALTSVRAAAWVASYAAADGAFAWADALTATGDVDAAANAPAALAPGLAADGDRLFVSGAFAGTIDLDPGPGTQPQTPAGGGGAYLVSLGAAAGTYAWGTVFGGSTSDFSYAVAADAAGAYVVGYTNTLVDLDPGAGTVAVDRQTFIASFDRATGTYRWAGALGRAQDGTQAVELRQLASDGARLYATGAFTGTRDFDPGPGTATLTSTPRILPAGPSSDVVLAAYAAATGAFVWAEGLANTPSNLDVGTGLAVSRGRLAAVGRFGGAFTGSGPSVPADFDPGPGTATLTTDSSPDVFVAYYDSATGAYAPAPVAGEAGPDGAGLALAAAPNPARGAATLTLTLDASQTVSVAVFDVLGREVARLHDGPLAAGTRALPLDTRGLPAGVYVVRAVAGGAVVSRQITVVR